METKDNPKKPFLVIETEEEFRSALNEAIEKGFAKALREAPVYRPFVPVTEVEEKVGRQQLTLWISQGLILPITLPGKPAIIDRMQINKVSNIAFV